MFFILMGFASLALSNGLKFTELKFLKNKRDSAKIIMNSKALPCDILGAFHSTMQHLSENLLQIFQLVLFAGVAPTVRNHVRNSEGRFLIITS